MTMHDASAPESWEPKAEIGDHFTMERTNQHWIGYLCIFLNQCQLCQLSGWKRFLYTAGCFRNKNVLKLEAGMLEKIRTF